MAKMKKSIYLILMIISFVCLSAFENDGMV